MNDIFHPLSKIAKRLGKSESTMKRYIKNGDLIAYNLSAGDKNNSISVKQEDYLKFIKSRRIDEKNA